MLKKILLVLLISVVFISCASFIVNRFVIPAKVKALIIDGLAKQTKKEVKLDKVEFSFFRGLVIKGLVVSDKGQVILSLSEADCSFLPLPFLKKEIIIPWFNIRQAQVFLERRPDNTFDIADFFDMQGQPQQPPRQEATQKKQPVRPVSGFNLIVKRINIRNSSLYFKDSTFNPAINKTLDNINASVYLSLPSEIKFNFKLHVPSKEPQQVSAAGIYNIPKEELSASFTGKSLQLTELREYISNYGLIADSGNADITVNLQRKNNLLAFKAEALLSGCGISKDNIKANFDSKTNIDLNYNPQNRVCKFSGQSRINNAMVSGLEFAGTLKGLSAVIKFNESALASDNITADILGIPAKAKLKIDNFQSPKLFIQIFAAPELENMHGLLKSITKFSLPVKLKGNSNLTVTIRSQVSSGTPPLINGALEFNNAVASAEAFKKPFTGVSGRIDFTQDSLEWKLPAFNYDGIDYTSTGSVVGFKAPLVAVKLKSRDISVNSEFKLNNKVLDILQCNAAYLDSEGSLSGTVDISRSDSPLADIVVNAKVSLNNLIKIFPKQLQKANPAGFVATKFSLSGNLNNINSCYIKGSAKAQDVRLFGLKADNLLIGYLQENGFGRIDPVDIKLYSGSIKGSVGIDYNKKMFPFTLKAWIDRVEIKELKNDTALKKNDIAGSLSSEVSLSGELEDAAKLNGVGKINIINGKLWQLNLFQGMGKLIFAKDFANIDFKEASCFFTVNNKTVSSDNIIMNSDLAKLTGKCRIGFDSAIDALINVQVSDKMIPVTGTFKDVATAIMGSAGRFGVITITGTLQKPRHQFKTAVVDIIKSVTEAIFQ